MAEQSNFKPFVPAETQMEELTVKSILTRCYSSELYSVPPLFILH